MTRPNWLPHTITPTFGTTRGRTTVALWPNGPDPNQIRTGPHGFARIEVSRTIGHPAADLAQRKHAVSQWFYRTIGPPVAAGAAEHTEAAV